MEKSNIGLGKSGEPNEKLIDRISRLEELVKNVDLVTRLAMWSLLVSVVGVVVASMFSILNLNSERENVRNFHRTNQNYYNRNLDKVQCF